MQLIVATLTIAATRTHFATIHWSEALRREAGVSRPNQPQALRREAGVSRPNQPQAEPENRRANSSRERPAFTQWATSDFCTAGASPRTSVTRASS